MSETEISEYEKLWKRIHDSINTTAKDLVPQLFEALKKEGYSAKEARDKIKKDAFNIWKAETIDKWIPAEAKQEIKVLAGSKGGIAKSEQEKKDSARSDLAEKEGEGEEKPDGFVLPEENRDRSQDQPPQFQNTNQMYGSPPPPQQQYQNQQTEEQESLTDKLVRENKELLDELTDLKSQITKSTKEQQSQTEYINKTELDTLRQQLQESREKIEYLQKQNEIQEVQIDKLEIQLNKIYSGTDDFEVKDKVIPLKWQFVILPKQKMVFDIDIAKARKMGI